MRSTLWKRLTLAAVVITSAVVYTLLPSRLIISSQNRTPEVDPPRAVSRSNRAPPPTSQRVGQRRPQDDIPPKRHQRNGDVANRPVDDEASPGRTAIAASSRDDAPEVVPLKVAGRFKLALQPRSLQQQMGRRRPQGGVLQKRLQRNHDDANKPETDDDPPSRRSPIDDAETVKTVDDRAHEFVRRRKSTADSDDLFVTSLGRTTNNSRDFFQNEPPIVVAATVDATADRCPADFRSAFDPNEAWFRSSVEQKSPKGHRQPNADGSDDFTDSDDVLILTPICNSDKSLQRYFENLCTLTYPHRRISVVLGEDSSIDGTLETAKELAGRLQGHFRRVEVLRLAGHLDQRVGAGKHDERWQLTRRQHMARARNELLSKALRSEKYVLWMDADVRHMPPDIIEHLIYPRKQIIVPNCMYRRGDGTLDTFDRNTWRETSASLKFVGGLKKSALVLEGYGPTSRLYLSALQAEGDLVPIDGVGGCVLLVEAGLHRQGLVFPPFVFEHQVETEGLAKMAAEMGVKMFGLPLVQVIHW